LDTEGQLQDEIEFKDNALKNQVSTGKDRRRTKWKKAATKTHNIK